VIGLIVILAGIVSMLLGGVMTRRAVQRKVGSISRDTMMTAQLSGAVPRFAPFAVLLGLVAVLVGIVLVIVL